MSIDIECLGRKGCFPEAEQDPVIQIASVVSTPGAKEPLLHHIVTLDTCSGIPGAQVEAYPSESDMLLRYVDVMHTTKHQKIGRFCFMKNSDQKHSPDTATQ